MKKANKTTAGELRSKYTRSDFGVFVRGKYIERLQESSNVVVLDPEVADVFPNAASVNAAYARWPILQNVPVRRAGERGKRRKLETFAQTGAAQMCAKPPKTRSCSSRMIFRRHVMRIAPY